MKKNNFKSLAAVLSLAMAATAVPVNVNAAAAPKITVSKKTAYSGKTYSATVKNLKKGYTVQFSSTEGGVNFKTKKVKATGTKVTAKFTVKAAKNIADNLKTKIKAVVKNAKGKKVKTVNQTITLKQLAKSITLKDLQATTVKVGEQVNADATIAPAAAKGAYKKTFTSDNSDVLKVTNASNGLFEAVAPGTATISVSAVNDKNKVVTGTKTITVTVVAAEEENKPDVPTPDQNQPGTTTGGAITTGPAILTEYKLSLVAGKSTVTANSKDNTDIGVLLQAPAGVEPNKDMTIAVQLGLDTRGVGSLSPTDTTLRWDDTKNGWYNVVRFTSATLREKAESKVTAAVYTVSANATEEDRNKLVGLGAQPITLQLEPEGSAVTTDGAVAQAVKAVVEQLDRITITFNKAVDRKDFLLDDDSGKVANGLNTQSVTNKSPNPQKFAMYIRDAVAETDNNYAETKAASNITHEDVDHIIQVNENTLTFVLRNYGDPVNARKSHYGAHFTDNSKFLVTFIDQHTGGTSAVGKLSDHISDTTVPTMMDVQAKDMKTIIVTFDQPIYSSTPTKDKDDRSDINREIFSALKRANFTIDGTNLWNNGVRKLQPNTTESRSWFGDPSTIQIKLVDDVARNQVEITLGKDPANNDGTGDLTRQCYLTAGTHILQVSSIGDYAASTETNNNNCITTKQLDFTVTANTAGPTFSVEAQSPEQYKVKFGCDIQQLAGTTPGQELTSAQINALGLKLVFQDTHIVVGGNRNETLQTALTTWRDASLPTSYNNGAYAANAGLGQNIKVTRLRDDENGNPQLKVEVTQDWTRTSNYKAPNHKNYFNYTLGIEIGKVTNAANGITSDVVQKPLTGLTNPDIKEPEIKDIVEVETETLYEVIFSEPVQASNLNMISDYAHAYTPGYNPITDRTIEIGSITAEFIKKGTNQSYPGTIIGYGNNLEDTSVLIAPSQKLDAGSEYTLIVRGVSDDVGNTSNTLTKQFSTKGAGEKRFRILSVLADGAYDDSNDNDKGVYQLDEVAGNPLNDVIYVEFEGSYATNNLVDTVLNTSNWNINGAELPIGSKIISGIKGINENNVRVDDELNSKGHSGVTIYLPNGTLTNIRSTLVKVGSNVKDTNNNTISYNTTFSTQSVFEDSIFADGQGDIKDSTGSYNSAGTKYEANNK